METVPEAPELEVGSGQEVSTVVLASDVNVAQNVGFCIIAAVMVVRRAAASSRPRTSSTRALWLVVVLGGAAAQYILAAAEFVAVSQVLIYIGAVMVLFLFGIMLTRATVGPDTDLNNKGWAIGIPVALGLLGVLGYVVFDTIGDEVFVDRDQAQIASTTTAISDSYHRRLPHPADRLVVRPARRRDRRHRPRPEGLNDVRRQLSPARARCCSPSACSA